MKAQNLYECDIIDDIYDVLFCNTDHAPMNFCKVFDRSYVESDHARIFLLSRDDDAEQFKITIERV